MTHRTYYYMYNDNIVASTTKLTAIRNCYMDPSCSDSDITRTVS